MVDSDERARMHSWVLQKSRANRESNACEGSRCPAPPSPADGGGRVENSSCAGWVRSSGSAAEPGVGSMTYIEDLVQRLKHLCAECGVPMPDIDTQATETIVRLGVIKCPPLAATCPADHLVRSWEIARIWWGIAMSGRPFAQQQEMARIVITLDDRGV
jgi:hypothetical protein